MTLIQKKAYKGVYDRDNVRFAVKNFVKDFNEFYALKGRPPVDSIDSEHPFYLKWCTYRNPKNLNAEEIEYVDKNLVKIGISWKIKQFVEEYNAFIATYGRRPTFNKKDPKELRLFERLRYYTCRKKLSAEEKQFLIENGILFTDEVRKSFKKFIMDMNQYIKENNKWPDSNHSLHKKWYTYYRDCYLSEAEKTFKKQNLLIVENVRECVKKFAKKLLAFIEQNGRLPKSSLEREFYETYWYYTKENNLKGDEKEYLESLGIEVKKKKNKEKSL